jgi:hypothetical protein
MSVTSDTASLLRYRYRITWYFDICGARAIDPWFAIVLLRCLLYFTSILIQPMLWVEAVGVQDLITYFITICYICRDIGLQPIPPLKYVVFRFVDENFSLTLRHKVYYNLNYSS